MLKKLRQQGLMYSAGIAINRVIPSWLFRFRIFRVYQVDPKTILQGSKGSDGSSDDAIQVSLTETEADLSAVCTLTWFQPSGMDADFESAQAKIDGQLAGAVWAAERGFDETLLGLRIELAPEQRWIFAALVDKQFRRRGVYSRVFGFMVNHLDEVADSQLFLSINPYNIASVKAHERYFDSVLGNVYALRVLAMAVCFCRGQRLQPSSWITFSSKSKPILIRLR